MNGLQIENLTVNLGNFKLDGINLNVKKGCITGLIGRNGAGKSTLIRAITRQTDDATGRILYNGKTFAEDEEGILNSMACVFDSPHFGINSKPKNLVKYYKAAFKNFDMDVYNRLTAKFCLPQNLRISKYSYGMQRKYCLVLALSCRPEILVLDEPTSGVDPIDRNEIIGLIQEYMMDENNTVLFSTHVTEDLDKIADYIVIFDRGKVVLDEDKNELTEKYRIVQCAEMTPQMRRGALGVRENIFGYTFLTADKAISGENIIVKKPTIEEIFVHMSCDEFGL